MSCIGKIYLSTFFSKMSTKERKLTCTCNDQNSGGPLCWKMFYWLLLRHSECRQWHLQPNMLKWFLLDGMVRQWAVVVSVFCAGWQCWHSTTVNHAESCWRQLWCFYQGESYLWYWLKIMIKYEWGHQVSLRVTSWAPAPRCEHSSPVSAARPPPAPHYGRYLEFDP